MKEKNPEYRRHCPALGSNFSSTVKALGNAKWKKCKLEVQQWVFSLKQKKAHLKLKQTFLLHLWSDKNISCMPAKANNEIQEIFHYSRAPQFWLFQENVIKTMVLKKSMLFLHASWLNVLLIHWVLNCTQEPWIIVLGKISFLI